MLHDLITINDHLRRINYELQMKIESNILIIQQNEQQIYKLCQHDWYIDHTMISEHTEVRCRICKLYK